MAAAAAGARTDSKTARDAKDEFGVSAVCSGQVLQGPLHAGVAVDALLRLEQLDRLVLLGEKDHPVRVLLGGAGGGVGVVVVDALRAGDERAPVFSGVAGGAFEGSVAKSGYLVTCLCDLPRGVEA